MKILITEPENYSKDAIRILEGLGEVILFSGERDSLESYILDVEVLVVKLKYIWNNELISKAKSLKYIVTSTTGLNHIQLAGRSNVKVLSLKGETKFLNTITPTAELTWALLLCLQRKVYSAIDSVKATQWTREEFVGDELYGKTIGIIGYGRLGRMVARYSVAFGMNILVHETSYIEASELSGIGKQVTLNELLAQSDIVTIHIPLESKNIGYLSREKLMLMKQNCIFINTSRGELVDEDALLDMLDSKAIAGVGLDVLSDEVSGDSEWLSKNKLIQSRHLGRELIITPHIGGACSSSMDRTEVFVANKLKVEIERNEGFN